MSNYLKPNRLPRNKNVLKGLLIILLYVYLTEPGLIKYENIAGGGCVSIS